MNLSHGFELSQSLVEKEPHGVSLNRVRTLGTLELEAKVELVSEKQIQKMIKRIRKHSDSITRVASREQFHTVFANNDTEYHGVVLMRDSNMVGVRSKDKGELIETPSLKLPAYVRNETSILPDDPRYVEHMRRVFQSHKIGSFDKRCTDIAFLVDNISFTATVSIVDMPNQRENGCYQLELEFNGHTRNTEAPGLNRILQKFERAYQIAFDDTEPSEATKVEWIATRTNQLDVIPIYTAITPDQSEHLRSVLPSKKKK